MRVEKFSAYELYAIYRDQLRDALDADAPEEHVAALTAAVERYAALANQEGK